MSTRPSLDQIGVSTGKKARLHRILYRHGLRNGTAIFLPYDQGWSTARGTSSPTRPPATPVHHQARAGGRLQWHRHPDRPGGEVLLGVCGRGPADPQAERQDRHPAHRSAVAGRTPPWKTRSGWARTRSATRCTSARLPRSGTSPVPGGPRGRRAARHAADRVVLPARRRDRRQGRQGLLLRGGLRRADRQRTRRRRGQGQLPAPGEAGRRARRLPARSSAPSRPSTRSSGRPTGRCCWSPAASRPVTRPCSRRHGSRWKPGATGLIFGRNIWQRDTTNRCGFVAQLQEILAKYPS